MKKILSILALSGTALGLSACFKESEDVKCLEEEVNVDGVCISEFEKSELKWNAISKGVEESTYNPSWDNHESGKIGFKQNQKEIQNQIDKNLNVDNKIGITIGETSGSGNDVVSGATATDTFQYYEVSQTAALRLMTNATVDTNIVSEAYAFTHDKNISKATYINGKLSIQEYFTPSYFTGAGVVEGTDEINVIAIGDYFFKLNEDGKYVLVVADGNSVVDADATNHSDYKHSEIYQWIRRDENYMKLYVDAIENGTLLVGTSVSASSDTLTLEGKKPAISKTKFMTDADNYGNISETTCTGIQSQGEYTLAKFCTDYMGGTWTETIGAYIINIEKSITSNTINFKEIFEMSGEELSEGGGTDVTTGVSTGLSDKAQYIEVMLRAISRSVTGNIEFAEDGTEKAYNYTHGGYITEAIATVKDEKVTVTFDEFFLPDANLMDFEGVVSVKIGIDENQVEYTAEEFQAAASTIGSNQASFVLTEEAMENYITKIKQGIFVSR